MKLNFKNRIAFYYLIATSAVSVLAFGFIYFIVQKTVYESLDQDLTFEANKHLLEIAVEGDTIYFTHKKEWEEIEHKEVQINPVFLQLMGLDGQVMDKSPNLKEDHLDMQQQVSLGHHYDTRLNNRPIRQVHIGIQKEGQLKGYIVAAVPLEASIMVLSNLMKTLLILFPVSIWVLFLISRYLAGKSIAPIASIISTTNSITKNNLAERVPLPNNKDELFELSTSINGLLDRIGAALEREKQFTSDASHELRTPLAALRGTLEVLVRKKRNIEDYEEKIYDSLQEVDRMSKIVEQLLFLARNDLNQAIKGQGKVAIAVLVDEILGRYQSQIRQKKISISLTSDQSGDFLVPYYYGNLMLDNLINNAIKYSHDRGKIDIKLQYVAGQCHCYIKDEGIGIREEDLPVIFNPFFRSQPLEHKEVNGNGLGLSIVKKAAEAIQAKIDVHSKFGKGTWVHLVFE
ncbi:HAMP domain-containing protein [Echinicola marina]|uniref:sensor histidine kinase n=1 Tax=Echinicola marina TaxID=2859768 RepID=UPI001CF6CC27|nr:ATP-binding protein [Echinicola marina]UCS92090.1 HAMP domain-containing protein [Echinicola marina]